MPMTDSDHLIRQARRICDEIAYDADGHGLPTPRPLLRALADRLETAEGERDNNRATAQAMHDAWQLAEARLNAASGDDLAERLAKMKAYPLGLAGQDPLVGITRDDLAIVRVAADRIRMDARVRDLLSEGVRYVNASSFPTEVAGMAGGWCDRVERALAQHKESTDG